MVEHPVGGGVALVLGIDEVGLFGGVSAQQIVEGVPAGNVFDDQVCADEFGEQRPRAAYRQGGKAGRGRSGDVRTGVQAEQPKQFRRGRAEGAVGPQEHCPHVGSRVPAGQRIEAVVGVAEFLGERREGEVWMVGGAGGHDRQRERQPAAVRDDLFGRVQFGGYPIGAEASGEQLLRLGKG